MYCVPRLLGIHAGRAPCAETALKRWALEAPRPFDDEFLDFVDKVEQALVRMTLEALEVGDLAVVLYIEVELLDWMAATLDRPKPRAVPVGAQIVGQL